MMGQNKGLKGLGLVYWTTFAMFILFSILGILVAKSIIPDVPIDFSEYANYFYVLLWAILIIIGIMLYSEWRY